jgi:PleD family two-component response regulator
MHLVKMRPLRPPQRFGAVIHLLSEDATPVPATTDKAIGSLLPERHALRILRAEDDRVGQMVTSRPSEGKGYRANIVDSELAAVSLIERSHRHLILMDVQVQEVDRLKSTCTIL